MSFSSEGAVWFLDRLDFLKIESIGRLLSTMPASELSADILIFLGLLPKPPQVGGQSKEQRGRKAEEGFRKALRKINTLNALQRISCRRVWFLSAVENNGRVGLRVDSEVFRKSSWKSRRPGHHLAFSL